MSEESDSDSESSPDSSVSVSDSISLDSPGIVMIWGGMKSVADEVVGMSGFCAFALRTIVDGIRPLGRADGTVGLEGLDDVGTPDEAPSELHDMSSSTVLVFLDLRRSVKKKKIQNEYSYLYILKHIYSIVSNTKRKGMGGFIIYKRMYFYNLFNMRGVQIQWIVKYVRGVTLFWKT